MDEKLLILINQRWTSPVLDRLMAAFSSFDAWVPIFVILIVILLIKGDFRMRAFLVTAGIVVAVNDGVVAHALKRIVDRPRPHQVLDDVRQIDLAKAQPRFLALFKPVRVKSSRAAIEDVEGRSFPSAHTVNCFSVALVAVCFFGVRVWWGFLVAALVAWSRIYTGSHWPSDVATSIFLGIGSTFLLLALAERIWQMAGRRWLPMLHAAHPSLLAV
jgi:undecaprenyl-diphosphatase